MQIEEENRALRRLLQQIIDINDQARASRDSMSFEDGLDGPLRRRWLKVRADALKILRREPPRLS